MGAKKLIQDAETIMRIVKSPKDALLSEATRHNPKQKEIKNQLKIVKNTEKLDAKTRVIPNTKEALAEEKKSVESREKTVKVTKKNGKKKVVKGLLGGALSLLGFAAGKDILSKKETEAVTGKVAEIVTDDKKLKQVNDAVEKDLKDKNGIIKKIRAEKDPAKKAKLRKKINEYRDKDFGFMDMIKDSWTSTAKNGGGKERWFPLHVFHFVGKFIRNIFFYRGVKKAEENHIFDKYDELKETSEELKAKGKEAKKGFKNAKKAKRLTKTTGLMAVKKIMGNESLKSITKRYQRKMSKITLNGKNAAAKSSKALIDLYKDVGKNGKQLEFQKLLKSGEIKGLGKIDISGKFKSLGKNSRNLSKISELAGIMGVVSAINISVYKAIEKGEFSEFWRSLFSWDTLSEAFIPGVGTSRSIKRVKNNPNQPFWLKATDIVLNVAGDGFLAAGYIAGLFSFGAGTAAGLAGRTVTLGIARKLLTREGIEIAAKGAAEVGGKILTKEGRKEALAVAGKTIKRGAKASLATSVISVPAQIFLKKMNPKKIEQAFVDNVLTDEQRRSVEISKRVEEEYKMDA